MSYYLAAITKNYANFNSRARRKEFWIFTVLSLLIFIALWIVDFELDTDVPISMEIGNRRIVEPIGIISGTFLLLTLIPFLAVGTRRLHDSHKSGLFQFLLLVPVVGWLILIAFYCQESYSSDNRWGNNPTRTLAENRNLKRRRRKRHQRQ